MNVKVSRKFSQGPDQKPNFVRAELWGDWQATAELSQVHPISSLYTSLRDKSILLKERSPITPPSSLLQVRVPPRQCLCNRLAR